MPFFHKIHCKYTGIKGILTVYHQYLKYRYMVTQEALRKAKILVFWEKHGLPATLDAFPTKRRTLYLWKKKFEESGGKIESLNDQSRTPKRKRMRQWNNGILEEIKRIRWNYPNLGKEKIFPILKKYCEEHSLLCPKVSTIGRIITDLGGLRIAPQRISHFGKIKPIKRRKLLRKPKDLIPAYPGHLVALDTIEKHINGTRRYIISFEDIFTRFGFAWSTPSHVSKAASEFFVLCQKIFPFPITFVLTDNGSEFAKEFEKKLRGSPSHSLSYLSKNSQDECSLREIQPESFRMNSSITMCKNSKTQNHSTKNSCIISFGTIPSEYTMLFKTRFLPYNSCRHLIR